MVAAIAESLPGESKSAMAIDVVIACIEKDLPILKLCIQAARMFITDGVDQLYVVAPESPGIRAVTQSQGGLFVNENEVFDLKRDDIRCTINGTDRSGWIYKQLLVLAADRISSNEHMLILDADTILIRPHQFLLHGKTTFFVSNELHPPYFEAYRKLLRMPWRFPLSFVSHYMLFEKRRLERLRADIERENERPWHEAILATAEGSDTISFFSEYETYGNYCLFKYPDDILIQYWNNLAMQRSMLSEINRVIARFQGTHRSVSFHTYLSDEV
jgi:hypothetical protein